MASAKELLAKKLQQNTEKHQQAQRENVKEPKEFRRNVAIADINKSPYQPRKIFNEIELQELANSIAEVGLLQPIAVRKNEHNKYDLIAGERRLRAHELLNKHNIEVIIVDVSPQEAALLTLVENLKRQDLTDYEIYLGLASLDQSLKQNKQQLAKSLGLNREDMYKYLSFEKLPTVILDNLNNQPSLLGRTAATAFKKFLADHVDEFLEAEQALLKAWSEVVKGHLEQTKATLVAEQFLRKIQPRVKNDTLVRPIKHNKKVTGHIKFDHKQLKVSLNISHLSEDKLQQLEDLLHVFLEDEVLSKHV